MSLGSGDQMLTIQKILDPDHRQTDSPAIAIALREMARELERQEI